MKYRNEEDKCYGITGMAIGITIWNGEDMLYKLDLDNEASQYVQFTSDYYFSGNPGIPAKDLALYAETLSDDRRYAYRQHDVPFAEKERHQLLESKESALQVNC